MATCAVFKCWAIRNQPRVKRPVVARSYCIYIDHSIPGCREGGKASSLPADESLFRYTTITIKSCLEKANAEAIDAELLALGVGITVSDIRYLMHYLQAEVLGYISQVGANCTSHHIISHYISAHLITTYLTASFLHINMGELLGACCVVWTNVGLKKFHFAVLGAPCQVVLLGWRPYLLRDAATMTEARTQGK